MVSIQERFMMERERYLNFLHVHVWLKVCHDQQLCSGKMNCTTFYTKYFMYFSSYSWCKLGIFWGSFFATLKFIFLLLFSLVILYYMICIVASCKAKILKNFSQNRLCMKSSMMIDLLTFFLVFFLIFNFLGVAISFCCWKLARF